MSTSERRTDAPVPMSSIGNPAGTITFIGQSMLLCEVSHTTPAEVIAYSLSCVGVIE
jgi:hypothetical protein